MRTGRRQRIAAARAVRGQPDPAVGTDLPVRFDLTLARLALVHELVKLLMELRIEASSRRSSHGCCGCSLSMVSLPSRMIPLRTAAYRAHAVQRIASRRRLDDGDGQRAHMPPLLKCTCKFFRLMARYFGRYMAPWHPGAAS